MLVGEIAAAELADGAIDLPQRPAQAQREQQHHDQHQRQQQRGFQKQLAPRPVGLRAAGHDVGVDLLVGQIGDAVGQIRRAARRPAASSAGPGRRAPGCRQHQRRGSAACVIDQALQLRLGASAARSWLSQRADDLAEPLVVLAKRRQHRGIAQHLVQRAPSARAARSART